MNLDAFYRAAGLPVALVISVLAHAALLRFMPFQVEKSPVEREAYLVTFENEAAPTSEGIPFRKVPPRVKEPVIRQEPAVSEESSRSEPLPEPRSETVRPEEESGREEAWLREPAGPEPERQQTRPREPELPRPERQKPPGEAAGKEPVKLENEAAGLDKAAHAKSVPYSEPVPRSQVGKSSEPEKESAVYDAAFNDELNRRIEKKKVYPPGARRQGIQGTVLCTLEVGPSGTLVGIEVVKSSGSKILDGAAVDLLKRVFPIDNPAGKPITLEKAIRYSLVE